MVAYGGPRCRSRNIEEDGRTRVLILCGVAMVHRDGYSNDDDSGWSLPALLWLLNTLHGMCDSRLPLISFHSRYGDIDSLSINAISICVNCIER